MTDLDHIEHLVALHNAAGDFTCNPPGCNVEFHCVCVLKTGCTFMYLQIFAMQVQQNLT